MVRKLTTVLIIGLLAASACIYAADWPRFQGPNGNGVSSEKVVNKFWRQKAPKMLWQIPMSDDGYAGPAVAQGKVFIVDQKGSDGVVRAIDLNSGKDVWKRTFKDGPAANYGFARSTPAVDGARTYVLGRLGQLLCLDTTSGKPIWTRNLVSEFQGQKPGWDYAMSPFVDGNKLIVVPGGSKSVAALDKITGKTLWLGGGVTAPSYATPVKAGNQYILFVTTGIEAVDAATGKLLWSFPWKTSYDVNAAQPIAMGSSVFITSGYGHGCALIKVPSSGVARAQWQNKDIQSHFSTPVLYEGYIYSTTDPGNLVCMDPKNGRVRWKTAGFEKGGMIIADGTIIAFDGAGGELVAASANPSGYKEYGRFNPLGGQSWTAPVVAQGRLIVRNKSTLACFSLK